MIIKLQDLETISMQDVNAAILWNEPAEFELVSITVALSDLDIDFIQ